MEVRFKIGCGCVCVCVCVCVLVVAVGYMPCRAARLTSLPTAHPECVACCHNNVSKFFG